jgi:non-heme chloroperoxidase
MHHADRRLRFAITRLATGLQVHYAEQGDPDGETILFLPAYADSWFSYSRMLPLLPARFHAFALDQRGHGDSERPSCCYTVDDLAADTVAFLDDAGIERATLVGHSGSCFTARRVAVTHPERVVGLVLIGAPLSLAKPAVVAFQATVHALEDPVPAEFAREFQAGAVHVPLPRGSWKGWWPRVSSSRSTSGRPPWTAWWPSTTRPIWLGSPRRRCSSGATTTRWSRWRTSSASGTRSRPPG